MFFPQRHVKNVISAFLELLFKELPKKNLENRLWVNVDHVSQKWCLERMYFFHFCTVIPVVHIPASGTRSYGALSLVRTR